MTQMRVALLHPGEMGAAIGAAVRGAEVHCCVVGRGEATRRRARVCGLHENADLDALLAGADVVLSVVPPHAALELAATVARRGGRGVYADLNAVSPATARRIETIVTAAGMCFVDGGIIGPPPRAPGSTRAYLCGAAAAEVAALFDGSALEARILAGAPGAASAHKMCYAAWTKGSAALLLAIRALARAEGVEQALLEEWRVSQPDLPARCERAAHDDAGKAWRFAGEMEEIAAAFAAADLPAAFHLAAAELWRRLEPFKDRRRPAGLDEVIAALLEGRDEHL